MEKMYGQSQGGSWKQKEAKRKNWRQDSLHSPLWRIRAYLVLCYFTLERVVGPMREEYVLGTMCYYVLQYVRADDDG